MEHRRKIDRRCNADAVHDEASLHSLDVEPVARGSSCVTGENLCDVRTEVHEGFSVIRCPDVITNGLRPVQWIRDEVCIVDTRFTMPSVILLHPSLDVATVRRLDVCQHQWECLAPKTDSATAEATMLSP